MMHFILNIEKKQFGKAVLGYRMLFRTSKTASKADPNGKGHAKTNLLQINSPGGGLDKPTDRDQRSWVFLNDPKKILCH